MIVYMSTVRQMTGFERQRRFKNQIKAHIEDFKNQMYRCIEIKPRTL